LQGVISAGMQPVKTDSAMEFSCVLKQPSGLDLMG
jgi:hypothetical protein